MRSVPHRRGAALVAAAIFLGACGGGASQSPSSAPPSTSPTTVATATPEPTCDPFPTQDVEFVVPYSAGGGFDTWARLVAPYLEEQLGGDHSVVVVNKSGAGGLVGVTEVYGSEPDGHTIAITEPGILATSQIGGTTEMDVNTIMGVGQIAVDPEMIVVKGDSPWNTIQDVQAAAADGPLLMGTGGLAAINIITFDALDIPFENIVHEGSSEAMLSVIRGDTVITIFPLVTVQEQVASGELKPLLLVGTPRVEGQPGYEESKDVPTLDEVVNQPGIGSALEQHRVIVAPPGTSECVQTALSDALIAALADPDFIAQATEAGRFPVPLTGAEATEVIQNTYTVLEGYADLLKEQLGE